MIKKSILLFFDFIIISVLLNIFFLEENISYAIFLGIISITLFSIINLYKPALSLFPYRVGFIKTFSILFVIVFYISNQTIQSISFSFFTAIILMSYRDFLNIIRNLLRANNENEIRYIFRPKAEFYDVLIGNSPKKMICLFDDRPVSIGRKMLSHEIRDASLIEGYAKTSKPTEILVFKEDVEKLLYHLNDLSLRNLVRVVSIHTNTLKDSQKTYEFEPLKTENILRRRVVPIEEHVIDGVIKKKSVLITGGAGSIGSELVRRALKYSPKKITIIDHCEFSLFKLRSQLQEKCLNCEVDYKLHTLLDKKFLIKLLRDEKFDIVIHAAAYKHVELAEYNKSAVFFNNVQATLNIRDACLKSRSVRKLLLISSDKAVRPTNLMGASKRICELIILGRRSSEEKLRTSAVRFGNVLGSSGSVIPIFEKQIKSGGPVTVTHPDVVRYFMTITEATDLVLQTLSLNSGSGLYLLDMGEQVRIVELAEELIRSRGLEPIFDTSQKSESTISIEFIGLRPGEKLYEELLISKNSSRTKFENIFTDDCAILPIDYAEFSSELRSVLVNCTDKNVIQFCNKYVEGYSTKMEKM